MIRVMLVDDQSMVRAGLRLVLETDPMMVVVAEAESGLDALARLEGVLPDVILLDIEMRGLDGLQTLRRITSEQLTGAKVLILTTFDRDDYLFESLRSGASGFLLKTAPPEDLIRAVKVVAEGDALLAPAVTRRVIAAAQHAPRMRPTPPSPRLSDREAGVLELVARGLSNAEISSELFVSEATVKTHVSSALAKLGVRDRVQAVIWAYENGFVRPSSGIDR